METLLSQVDQLPSLLAASRSGLVRKWSPETVSRSLRWARFFHRLHRRLGSRSGLLLLRAALQRRLTREGLHLGHLGRCPELLALALLENGALPSAARGTLLQALLSPESQEEEEEEEEEGEGTPTPPLFVPLLARRKAASQLLLLGHLGPEEEGGGGPAEKAQAQLLLSRLKEGGSLLLEQLPRGPALFQAVAAALLLEPRGGEAEALLPWLLQEGGEEEEEARLAGFYRSLPASLAASLCARHPPLLGPYLGLLARWGARLHYDPLLGKWGRSSHGGQEEEGEEETSSWEELAQRLRRLLAQEPRVRSQVWAELKRLRAQEGGFGARGLSVWTDLLLDLEGPQQEEEPPPRRPQPTPPQ